MSPICKKGQEMKYPKRPPPIPSLAISKPLLVDLINKPRTPEYEMVNKNKPSHLCPDISFFSLTARKYPETAKITGQNHQPQPNIYCQRLSKTSPTLPKTPNIAIAEIPAKKNMNKTNTSLFTLGGMFETRFLNLFLRYRAIYQYVYYIHTF